MKTPIWKSEKSTSAKVAPDQNERARAVVRRTRLVHFPVSAELATVASWGALRSRASLGYEQPVDPKRRLRHENVFLYVGPSCYGTAADAGHVLLVFLPTSDRDRAGNASPFDSGALLEEHPRLQPWAEELVQGTLDDVGALGKVDRYSVTLAERPEAMRRWLAYSFDEPERYLDTSGNRDDDGLPDRLDPSVLLKNNGAPGRAKKRRCADRRAFTWEVRIEADLDFTSLERVVVAEHMLQEASDAFVNVVGPSGITPLPAGSIASAEAFYGASGSLHEDSTIP